MPAPTMGESPTRPGSFHARPLVELAIGNGRVAIPVLAHACARATETGVELDLRQGDMRSLTLDEPADWSEWDEQTRQ